MLVGHVIVRVSEQDHRTFVLGIVHAFGNRANIIRQVVQALNSTSEISRRNDHGGPHSNATDTQGKRPSRSYVPDKPDMYITTATPGPR
jgi:hypothetical protein